jgi:hypothetical protein
VLLVQCHADVLAFRVLARVLVVPHVAGFCCEDAMVAPEFAVFAGEPRGAALAEDDVAGDDVLACEGDELVICGLWVVRPWCVGWD